MLNKNGGHPVFFNSEPAVLELFSIVGALASLATSL